MPLLVQEYMQKPWKATFILCMFDSKGFKIEIYYLKGRKANKNIIFSVEK